MSARLTSSARPLKAAFAAVAVAFVLSTAVAEYSELEIRHAATAITTNAAPRIARLSEVRAELRRLIVLTDDAVDAAVEGRPSVGSLDRAGPRRSMDEAWRQYRALPSFAGERELAAPAERAKARVDASLASVEHLLEQQRSAEARQVLDTDTKAEAERLDTELVMLTDLNARMGGMLAERIDRLGRHSILLAILLDTISVLLTVLTALLTVRVIRRYTSTIERRAEELELFAGRVAHDVLGPLGAAAMALEVAQREAPPGGRTARVLLSGKAGLQRARTIADGLLEFARAGARPSGNARADVMEVIGAVVEECQPAAQERGITMLIEAAVHPGAAACSPGILTSLVSNLVRNAVKYVGVGPGRRITVRARPVRGRVRIEVEDNGRGLPPELGDHVFEPYVRGAGSQQPGIGLGLATVKKITEAHGGRVDVRSVPGLGCRFGVELPAAPPEPPPRTVTRPGRGDKDSIDRPAHAP